MPRTTNQRSDGVHDNLDARNLGKQPGDLDSRLKDLSWLKAAESFPTNLSLQKELFMHYFLRNFSYFIRSQSLKTVIAGDGDNNSNFSPTKVVTSVLDYCLKTTGNIRFGYILFDGTDILGTGWKRIPVCVSLPIL